MAKLNIYKRKDGRYEGRLYLGKDGNNKRTYKSYYGITKDEVIKKYECSLHSHNSYSASQMNVRELVIEWLGIMSTRIKESTAANYRMKAEKHIIPYFGDTNICKMDSRTVYSFIEKKIKSGLSTRYIADILVLLKSIFKYAQREYNVKNVIDGIVIPRKARSEVRLFTEQEQIILKNYISTHPDPTNLGIAVSLYTGLRIGELCALQWSDIDFEKRTLTVRKTIQRIQGTNGDRKTKLVITEPKSDKSKREIPIPDCLLIMLNKHRSDKNLYVLSGKKKPIEPRTMQYRFAKVLNNVGLPSVHFHSLRHAFATNAVALGFDVKTLSELLGHSSIELTLNRYVHSSMDRKRACMDLLKWSA